MFNSRIQCSAPIRPKKDCNLCCAVCSDRKRCLVEVKSMGGKIIPCTLSNFAGCDYMVKISKFEV